MKIFATPELARSVITSVRNLRTKLRDVWVGDEETECSHADRTKRGPLSQHQWQKANQFTANVSDDERKKRIARQTAGTGEMPPPRRQPVLQQERHVRVAGASQQEAELRAERTQTLNRRECVNREAQVSDSLGMRGHAGRFSGDPKCCGCQAVRGLLA